VKVSDLLAELGRRDIHVWGDGDRLRCNAPAGALTPDVRDQLRDRKGEILEFLRTAEAVARQQPAIVPLQPGGTRTPFFGVPGHTGDVFSFVDLAKRLGDDQPMFGLQPPGLDGHREPLTRVEDLAAYFAAQIRSFRPDGPYIIAGYCAGGAIAYELARQLVEQGATVDFLALFGCPFPTTYRVLPTLVERTTYWTRRVVLHVQALANLRSFEARRRYVAERIRGRVEELRKERVAAESDAVLALRARLSEATIAALRRYTPPRYSGRVCLFLPHRAWLRSEAAPLRWRTVAGDTETYFGPDNCNGPLMLLEPDAPAFADLFTRCRERNAQESLHG
jgi:thioesterase domain-containing protein